MLKMPLPSTVETLVTWTPLLALVARSLAMEWTSLGLEGREMALKAAIRLPRLSGDDGAAVQRPIH
jgi:hypothetical protein